MDREGFHLPASGFFTFAPAFFDIHLRIAICTTEGSTTRSDMYPYPVPRIDYGYIAYVQARPGLKRQILVSPHVALLFGIKHTQSKPHARCRCRCCTSHSAARYHPSPLSSRSLGPRLRTFLWGPTPRSLRGGSLPRCRPAESLGASYKHCLDYGMYVCNLFIVTSFTLLRASRRGTEAWIDGSWLSTPPSLRWRRPYRTDFSGLGSIQPSSPMCSPSAPGP
ncbi:hypothetical protein V8F06_000618 [Rhypophila decipiens]